MSGYRMKSLREEALALRKVAHGCPEHPQFCRLVLELAEKCEQLADAYGDRLQRAQEPALH